MEPCTQSEYTLVRRAAAVAVRPTAAEAPLPPADKPEKPSRRRMKRSGEGKLLLAQSIAGAVLLGAVALGSALGGAGFRAACERIFGYRSVDLPALVEPLDPAPGSLPETAPGTAPAMG